MEKKKEENKGGENWWAKKLVKMRQTFKLILYLFLCPIYNLHVLKNRKQSANSKDPKPVFLLIDYIRLKITETKKS
jgi:hypothetical protein